MLKLITHKQFYIFMSLLNTPCKHSQCRVGKVCEPLDLITGRNNLSQMFSVVAEQTCTTVWRNFRPFLFATLFQVSNILGMSGVNCSLEVMPQHLNWVEVGTLNGPIFFCWSHSVVDLFLCFGSLSGCIIQLLLSFNWLKNLSAYWVCCTLNHFS